MLLPAAVTTTGSRDTQEVVDQSSRATRGARPAGSLERVAISSYTRALTRSLPLPLYLSSCALSLPLRYHQSRLRDVGAPDVFPGSKSTADTTSFTEAKREDEGGFSLREKRRRRRGVKDFFPVRPSVVSNRTSVRIKVGIRAFSCHSPNAESASERNHCVFRTDLHELYSRSRKSGALIMNQLIKSEHAKKINAIMYLNTIDNLNAKEVKYKILPLSLVATFQFYGCFRSEGPSVRS